MRTLIVALTGLFAGFFLGLVSLGAGYSIGPALTYLRVRPEVSTVTCSFILVVLSFTALVQYFVFGAIDYHYGVLYFCVAIAGGLVGILVLRRIAISRGRASLLIFAAAFTLTVAFIIFPSIGVYNAVEQSKNGTFQVGFKSLCK